MSEKFSRLIETEGRCVAELREFRVDPMTERCVFCDKDGECMAIVEKLDCPIFRILEES